MKKILLSSLMAAAAAMPALAGVDNINYQAVIKNGTEVVANKSVEMKFELLDNETVVYTDEQNLTTNAAGYVSCQLGGEELSTIKWGDLTLRVSVNLGSGYEVISTEAVSSVPTALYALRSADSDMIIEEMEQLVQDNENTKETILGVNAQLASFEGFIEEVEAFNDRLSETLEPMMGLNYEEICDFHERVNETLINLNEFKDDVDTNLQSINDELAKIQGLDYEEINDFNQRISDEIARINDALTLLKGDEFVAYVSQLNALKAELEEKLEAIKPFADIAEDVTELKGQVENLNMVSAVVRENEAAIEGLQGDFKNLGENLDNFGNEMNAKFDEVNGQLENLNNVAAVTRANEEAIENLTEQVDQFATMNETRIDKLQKQVDTLDADIIPEIEGLVKDNEEIKNNLKNISADVAQVEGLAEKVEMLEDSMEIIASPTNPESMMSQINNAMGELGEAVEGLVQENEETKSRLNAISADVAQIEGLAKEVEELNTNTDAFATMVEERFDKVQGNVDANTKAIDALTEQVDAFATMNETRIDKLQKQVDGLEEEVATLKDTLNQLIEALKELDILPSPFNAGK